MSLGVSLIWSARSRAGLVQRVLRESRFLQPKSTRLQSRRWLSSSPEPTSLVGELKPEKAQNGDEALTKATSTSPASSSWSSTFSGVWGRGLSRRDVRRLLQVNSHAVGLIRRAIRYPRRRASYRSLRRHRLSFKRQALHEHSRDTLGKPVNDWRSTLDFMIRHTPNFGNQLNFKVVVGKGASAHARSTLSDLDTNIWQIQQRNHCKIRIESGAHEDAPLVLSLSGTNISVRETLSDLVTAIGKVSAVRILDPALATSLSEALKSSKPGQRPIRLIRDEKHVVEDEAITVYNEIDTDFVKMSQRPRVWFTQMKIRADEVPRPVVWTKASFEQYVSKLVLGWVPNHMHKILYPTGPHHQEVVCNILTELFTSDDLRHVMSLSALKMALRYMNLKGSVFRPAHRAIFYYAEQNHLPLDAEAFQSFLANASTARDLQAFNRILRAMNRKGFYVRAETWVSFLLMIEDPQIKSYIIRRMKMRGLFRLQPIQEELGRQTMMINLERLMNSKINIQRLVKEQDEQYGLRWLNTKALNKMLDELGVQGRVNACKELLDFVSANGRAQPSRYTLNTLMTHTWTIPQKVEILSRWPWLTPDDVTYHILFHAAWQQRLPNMLRVIWRYAAFSGHTTSPMRHNLTKLLHLGSDLSKQKSFLKAWEDVILGRSELAANKHLISGCSTGFGAAELIKVYRWNAGTQRPSVALGVKLQEAYDMDIKIHKLITKRTEMTPSLKASLTVQIPLGEPQLKKKKKHAAVEPKSA